mmetsp:Transcript_22433/g.48990  ORF Transcript_22433/g.48990 Transcript_22433/m.48990 type:complete len:96 (+) Transcript_22433:338-625(+)
MRSRRISHMKPNVWSLGNLYGQFFILSAVAPNEDWNTAWRCEATSVPTGRALLRLTGRFVVAKRRFKYCRLQFHFFETLQDFAVQCAQFIALVAC